MTPSQKEIILALFNSRKLDRGDADWYRRMGYTVVYEDGQAVDLIWEDVV